MPSSAAVSQTATPQPNYSSSAFAPPPQKPATDPFAAIASGSFSSKPASPSPPKPVAATTAADDDEWSFSSAAAAASAPSVPKEHKIAVSSSDDLDILLHATRPTGGKSIHLKFDFINRGRHRLEDMDFQLAVTKVGMTDKSLATSLADRIVQAYELLTTQLPTGHVLLPQSLQPITEAREVWHAGDRNRKVDSIKLRWRLSYKRVPAVAGSGTAVPVEEKGEIPEFSIA